MTKQTHLKDWFLATRPWSFPASMMPAIATMAYIFFLSCTSNVSNISLTNGVIALLGVVLFQASGNLISDYFDYKYGVDQKDTYGSSRLIVDGLFRPKTILFYGLTLLLIGCCIGLFLFTKSDAKLLLIGGVGVLGTFFYYRLKYSALGDLTIFILYGLLIALGTMYVMTGEFAWQVLLISTPIGLLITNILHANNTRDIAPDRRAGITTFAMKLGLPASKALYLIHAVLAYVFVLTLVFFSILPLPCLLVLISLPLAISNIKTMNRATADTPDIIKDLDKDSAKLVLIFSALLIIGNIIAPFL